MTIRSLLVVALLIGGGVYGARYAHDRFTAQKGSYALESTQPCLSGTAGFRTGSTESTDAEGTRQALVVFTAGNGAVVRFYDSSNDAAYAKTEFDAAIQRTGHDSAGLVDVKNNAVVGWKTVPSDADRTAVLGCLR